MNINLRLKANQTFLVSVFLLMFLLENRVVQAQVAGALDVNLSALDGVGLTPTNILSYGIQSNLSSTTKAAIKGTVRYKQTGLSFSYTFQTTLRPGLNQMNAVGAQPQWTFSANALRELFMDYQFLPQGTYEYCVEVVPVSATGEMQPGAETMECLYKTADDIFLINLLEPEDDAKLYEHFPVFSWIVNYAFASQLTYRIRVAEVKKGQNNATAITRNKPVYTESNLPQTTTTYPVYGHPLELFQPYSWTVDAYYKGILLGGAEPWRFTIVEDSEMVSIPREVSFLDIKLEQGGSQVFAIGKLKLKYVLNDLKADSLCLRLMDGSRMLKLKENVLFSRKGDNRYEIDLYSLSTLKHLKMYDLELSSQTGEKYRVRFKYVNPDFLTN